MKKYLKFKKIEDGIKLTKGSSLSTKDRKDINKLLLEKKMTFDSVKVAFKVIRERKTPVKVHFKELEDIKFSINVFNNVSFKKMRRSMEMAVAPIDGTSSLIQDMNSDANYPKLKELHPLKGKEPLIPDFKNITVSEIFKEMVKFSNGLSYPNEEYMKIVEAEKEMIKGE